MAKGKGQGDPQFEITFFENVLKHSPNFVEALGALGDLYTREGFFQKGLEVDERLAELRPLDPLVHYNLACSYSLLKDISRSAKMMKCAILLGYDDFSYLEKDPDLVNLLADGEFVEHLRMIRPKARAARSDG